MAEGNETSDVWGRTADIDESALSIMAERLESRAKHPFFRRVIAEYIGDLELKRISSALEIGCGTGVVSRALAVAPGFRGTITGTDVSPHLIDAGRRYAEMEGVEGRVAFEVSGAADLHAENSTYDLIIAHTLFSHAANPVAILAECGRVLRSRGQLLILTIPAPGGGGDSGLAWAEGSLWVGQHRGRKIHQIDPQTGAILRTIEFNRIVTGVTWIDGELWHGTWEGDDSDVRRVDPKTDEVLEHLDMPPGVGVSGTRVGRRRSVLLRRRQQRQGPHRPPAQARCCGLIVIGVALQEGRVGPGNFTPSLSQIRT